MTSFCVSPYARRYKPLAKAGGFAFKRVGLGVPGRLPRPDRYPLAAGPRPFQCPLPRRTNPRIQPDRGAGALLEMPMQLPLPMTPEQALYQVIVPALAELDVFMDTRSARVQMLAMAMQESNLAHRHQVGGPAHGLWQFERGGGVKGVLTHSASQRRALALCERHGVAPTIAAAYDALEHDDVLAAGFARLLLLTLPKALPPVGDEQGAWDQYIEAWRPGKPHRDRWAKVYPLAVRAVESA